MGAVADAVTGVQPNHPTGLFPPPLLNSERYRKQSESWSNQVLTGKLWASLTDWQSFPEGIHRHRFFSGTTGRPRIVKDYVRQRAIIDQRIWAAAQKDAVGMAVWELEMVPAGDFLFERTSICFGGSAVVATAFRKEGDRYVYTYHSPVIIERNTHSGWGEYCPLVECFCAKPSSLSLTMRGYLIQERWESYDDTNPRL